MQSGQVKNLAKNSYIKRTIRVSISQTVFWGYYIDTILKNRAFGRR
jgi:hypothetical protein